MKSLHISIDRLVIEGLAPSQQKALLAELRRQLNAWASGGLPEAFAVRNRLRLDRLDAGALRPGASPAQAAAQVVQGLRGAIGPTPAKPNKGGGGHG
jgi:hypothetical protein